MTGCKSGQYEKQSREFVCYLYFKLNDECKIILKTAHK